MSISIQGTLSIKAVNGRSGSFCVGDLMTDIGTFKVKDAILDQYAAGDYVGTFVIDEICPSSYTWRGKVWVEVRAKLSSILVDSEPESTDAEALPESVEPDPADEVAASAQADTSGSSATPVQTGAGVGVSTLFDKDVLDLIETGSPVKLDPTVDRGLFRAQRDALKGHGYRFDASAQMWELRAE